MKTFPVLYKRTSGGQIEQWRIWVQEKISAGVICTEYGHVGGKLQETSDSIAEGKNFGKANATSALQQAEKEAEARWKKKLARGGYVESLERASAGEDDAEGGIAPMLAQPEDKGIKKIVYPVDTQRKLNGNRCIAVVEDGAVSLWSRKRKRITGFPHIEAAYTEMFGDRAGTIVFDGELYRYGWSLQKISGYCRSDEPKAGHEEIQHWVYDYPTFGHLTWMARKGALEALRSRIEAVDACPITVLETETVASYEEAKARHDAYVAEGFEGLIFRNHHGLYEQGKRSYNLVKLKAFQEEEFEIVGITDGRGKFAGKAVFKCRTKAGKEFDCCSPGTMADRAAFMAAGDKLVGKHLTVKYFEWSDDGVPLFPVGLVVRDYE